MRIRAKYVSVNVASGRGVADRWRTIYFTDYGDKWREGALAGGKMAEKIHTELCQLGANPDIAKIAEVIGNKSWSYISCDGCSEHVERAVAIGDGDYSERKSYCETCLREALAALEDTKKLIPAPGSRPDPEMPADGYSEASR